MEETTGKFPQKAFWRNRSLGVGLVSLSTKELENSLKYINDGLRNGINNPEVAAKFVYWQGKLAFKKKSKNELKEFLTTCSVGTPTHFMECWRSVQ